MLFTQQSYLSQYGLKVANRFIGEGQFSFQLLQAEEPEHSYWATNPTGHYNSKTWNYTMYWIPQTGKTAQSSLRHQIKDVTVLSSQCHTKD